MLTCLIGKSAWKYAANRSDQLTSPKGLGVKVDPPTGSTLRVVEDFPSLGKMLFKRAFNEWPIEFSKSHQVGETRPQISFVIPHRGIARFNLLEEVIRSIHGQEGVAVECIVVEQSNEPEIERISSSARYLHLPHPQGNSDWRKCWAYNVGVNAARAEIVVCHDGDIVVPRKYAAEILRNFSDSTVQVQFLQRFLFYLTESTTSRLISTGILPRSPSLEKVSQNWRGGTLAIRRDAYRLLGGFDERFVNWTGEDREFYDRCLSLNGIFEGYLPFIHLWHPPQPTKFSSDRKLNMDFTDQVMKEDRHLRIEKCRDQLERYKW